MSTKELLTGKATGGPLFVAWCIGVLLAYLLEKVVTEFTDDDSYYFWLGIFVSFLFLSTWQSVLLLPTWKSRLAFIACILVLVVRLANVRSTRLHTVAASFVWVLQTLPLIDHRRRWGLWLALALVSHIILISDVLKVIDELYFVALHFTPSFIPPFLMPRPFLAYVYGFGILFGLLVSLGLPSKARGRKDTL